jgi:hypothetical protein
MKMEAFNPADLDHFPPGEPWPNGPDARARKRFELISFDKIVFNTVPPISSSGLSHASAFACFGGRQNAAKAFSFSISLGTLRSAGNTAGAGFAKAPSSIAHSRGRPALETALKRSGNASLPKVRGAFPST